MRTTLTQPQLERLKRQAKQIAGERPGSMHSAILDELARKFGWTNWALMAKNVRPEILKIRWKEIGTNGPGVFEVTLEVVDPLLRSLVAKYPNQFVLPTEIAWVFRVGGSETLYPIIDVRYGDRRGVFIDGKWTAILSFDGIQDADIAERTFFIQDADIAQHIARTFKPTLTRLLCAAAGSLLDAYMEWHEGDSFRLLYAKPHDSGVHEVVEACFDTLEKAQNTALLNGSVPIGIAHRSAYWLWRSPFGWMGAIRQ